MYLYFANLNRLSTCIDATFRCIHSVVRAFLRRPASNSFAEEIAFFGGKDTEKMLVEREHAELVKHENIVLRRRWWHGCVEEGIVKWLWGSFGV